MKNWWLIVVFGLILSACVTDQSGSSVNSPSSGEWVSSAYASYFAIKVSHGDTVIYLLNPANNTDTLTQYKLSTAQPLLATISTTHVPMIQALGALDQLAGVGYPDYITDLEVRQRLDDGRLRSITSSNNLNFEVVIDVQPDVLLVYPYGNENYDRYEQSGITVLPISEYAESHPLGRAEWIKVFGLLTGNYARADRLFNQIKTEYIALKKEAMLRSFSPLVFTGSFYKGHWSAPGGDSFVAQYIRDAGARYAFAEYPGSENVELDFERVLEKISSADFFGKVLHRKGGVTRDDFLEENRRFELLNDFGDDQLFYCNSYTSDYFGRGLLEPHLIISDLYHIFHSTATASVEFHYFKPLSIRED